LRLTLARIGFEFALGFFGWNVQTALHQDKVMRSWTLNAQVNATADSSCVVHRVMFATFSAVM
jgi:hypothetical protein